MAAIVAGGPRIGAHAQVERGGRRDREGAVEIGDGLRIFALAEQRDGAIVERGAVVRIDPERQGVIGNGGVEIAVALMDGAAIVVGGRIAA